VRASILAAVILSATSTLPSPVRAQLALSNFLEARIGRDPEDPFADPSRLSRFDQLNADYTRDALRLGFRFEGYIPSDRPDLDYALFVRRYAGWTTPHFAALVGNYEAIFGRGLVLRAFELPGVVREEFETPQFGDSRDLDGVRLEVHDDRWTVLALQGAPRRADQDPTVERSGTVAGATGWFDLTPVARVGANYLRTDRRVMEPGATNEIAGPFLQLGFEPWLQRAGISRLDLDTYLEYARVTGLTGIGSPNAPPNEGYGLYASQSLFLDEVLPGLRWGVSWEYKDYQNFELGVNEPPTLVREHAFVLLNRSTHVLVPQQEEGYQFETRFDYRQWADLVVNLSRAENFNSLRFEERYLETSGHWSGATLTLFADEQEDRFESVGDRDTFGGYLQVPFLGAHSLELQAETQETEIVAGNIRASYGDRYWSLTYGWAGRLSLGGVRQTTNDPDEVADPNERRAYDSLTARVPLGRHHEVQATWGRTRGGLACVAGTCYKVRGFDGVSARLTSRF